VFFIGSRYVYSYFPIDGVETQKINDKNDSPEAYVFKLKPFIDMNLSAEYRYNKKVSAFIQFNNFTAKKYQYWTNFPVQSINIMGGVTLSF
jgi:outer membrane receptor protein involved in Fe transport